MYKIITSLLNSIVSLLTLVNHKKQNHFVHVQLLPLSTHYLEARTYEPSSAFKHVSWEPNTQILLITH